MLYLAADGPIPVTTSADLRIEPVNDQVRGLLRPWFSGSEIRFIGAHTGCSCGFPSVIAESPLDYYDGMSLDSDDREADLRSVRALIALLEGTVAGSGVIELYPVAEGDEGNAPKGVVDWQLDSVDPEQFFFTEGFKYLVRRIKR